MTTILELNDADLTLYHDGRPVYRAPGIAVISDQEIFFGERALRLSRMLPRQTNLQYFSRMSGDPLGHTVRRARNHADLVYLHLLEISKLIEEEIVLAVPAVFSAEQLGVLLGILQEAGVTVAGFVDSAVATASSVPMPPRALHLDVLMQGAVLTSITADDQVSRMGVEVVNECGLARLLDGWTTVVADRFIRETRFDPLHSAATEQQLFNQVFDQVWSGTVDLELVVELVQGDQTRRVELGRQVLEERSAQRFRQITDLLPADAHVLLTGRCATLPGLLNALRDVEVTVTILSDEALPLGCQANLAQIAPANQELRLVTRLPRRAPLLPAAPAADVRPPATTANAARTQTSAASSSADPATAALPTHALVSHRALPLGHATLGFSVVRHGTLTLLRPAEGLALNGTPIFRDTTLEVGDRITHDRRDYLVISVEG